MQKTITLILAIALLFSFVSAGTLTQTARAASESDLTFTLNGTGDGYVVTDCDESARGELVIPAIYKGLPVTGIGQYAFDGCIDLNEIVFKGSAPAIGNDAFRYVNATVYYYPDATWTEDVRQNYGGTIFWEAMEVEPEIVATGTCGDNLIWSLDTEGILAIYGAGEMEGRPWEALFEAVKIVVIGDGVTSISDNAFTDYPNLTGIWVGDENADYSSDEYGVLFNKDKTILIQAPGALSGSYQIPDSVVSVGNYAFGYCADMTSVTIGSSVEIIGISAFVNCTGLTGDLIIPDSVIGIGVGAFYGCPGLASVTIGTGMESIDAEVFSGCTGLQEISFAGSAPAIDDFAFSSVTATAYYNPDETWTEDVRQNYGGNITWTPYGQEHTCEYTATVTAPTCTEQGYTTYTCAECGDSYIGDYKDSLGHDYQRTSTTEPTCTEDGFEIYTCSRCGDTKEETLLAGGHHYGDDDVCDDCGHTASGGVPENALQLPGDEFAGQDTVWIEGVPYPVQGEGEDRYIALPEAEEFLMVTYTYHEGDGQDVHTQYPTGMKVYQVKDGEITYIPELENLLQYSGSSIRITGKKGIRMITSIEKDKKNALTGKGLAGYTLVEYGTVLCFASEIPEGDGLVLGRDYARSNYAYKKGVADPVFATSGNLVQYTNVLVGFSLDQCKDDIAMRPYIILQNDQGEQITLYGGTIYRSIGYIAYQNRNVFQPKTASYNYVWEIIHHVYGDKYDEEFKG